MPRRRESVSRRFNKIVTNSRYGVMENRITEVDVTSLYPHIIEFGRRLEDVLDALVPHRKLKRFLASISKNNPQNNPNFNVLEKGK